MYTLDIYSGTKIVKRNYRVFLFCLFGCAAIALSAAFYLPKQFKSRAVLNIQSSYFQNPLVSDLVTQVTDPQELQSQRISLLRMSLTPEFIEQMAHKYSIYSKAADSDSRLKALEKESFSNKIQYYSLSPTTFEISAKAENPEDAKSLVTDIIEQMQQTLIDERYQALARTRNAIELHVRNLGDNIQKITSPVAEMAVQSELEKVEASLAGLLVKFTDSHPEVRKLRQKQTVLQAQQPKAIRPEQKPDDPILASAGSLAKAPAQEVYNDLLKKLNYLGIVLDMEKDKSNVSYLGLVEKPTLPISALFPNKKLFLALGLLAGIVLGTLLTLIVELGRREQISMIEASQMLEAPFFGELPLANHSASVVRQKSINYSGSDKLSLPA